MALNMSGSDYVSCWEEFLCLNGILKRTSFEIEDNYRKLSVFFLLSHTHMIRRLTYSGIYVVFSYFIYIFNKRSPDHYFNNMLLKTGAHVKVHGIQ